jgi:hypothetical protein
MNWAQQTDHTSSSPTPVGGNRTNSLDGRYWGFVPPANLIGRPLVIYWSFKTSDDQIYKPSLNEDQLHPVPTHPLLHRDPLKANPRDRRLTPHYAQSSPSSSSK